MGIPATATEWCHDMLRLVGVTTVMATFEGLSAVINRGI